MAAGWLFVACTIVIVFDVVTRKFGFQLPGMGSTRLQELEWHLHTVLFLLALGYAYVTNAHVRVDLLLNALPARFGVGLELAADAIGALVAAVLLFYGLDATLKAHAGGWMIAKTVVLWFDPPAFFMLAVLGLTALTLAGGSMLRGLIAGCAGLFLGFVGYDDIGGITVTNPRR